MLKSYGSIPPAWGIILGFNLMYQKFKILGFYLMYLIRVSDAETLNAAPCKKTFP